MNPEQITEFRNRLLPQAIALVEQATGGESDRQFAEAVISACKLLELSTTSESPIAAIERTVKFESGVYLLQVRRLETSNPPGKFQILITRELASGVIF
ncbi:MAG TPA: hypothetical protein V6C78_25945 [Crinalium sp.]